MSLLYLRFVILLLFIIYYYFLFHLSLYLYTWMKLRLLYCNVVPVYSASHITAVSDTGTALQQMVVTAVGPGGLSEPTLSLGQSCHSLPPYWVFLRRAWPSWPGWKWQGGCGCLWAVVFRSPIAYSVVFGKQHPHPWPHWCPFTTSNLYKSFCVCQIASVVYDYKLPSNPMFLLSNFDCSWHKNN